MRRVVTFIVLVWVMAVTVHFLWEAWIILDRGYENLPVCRHWWCPEGIKNRVKRDP